MSRSKQNSLDALAALMRGESLPAEQTRLEDPEEVKFAMDVGALVKSAHKKAMGDPAYAVAILHGALGEMLNEIFADGEEEDETRF